MKCPQCGEDDWAYTALSTENNEHRRLERCLRCNYTREVVIITTPTPSKDQ